MFKATMYLLFLSKISNWIIAGFYVFFFLSILILYFFDDNGSEFANGLLRDMLKEPLFYIIVLFPIFASIVLFYATKRNLSKNYRLKENIEFIFNPDFFQEKGETFDVKHFWKVLLKVKERNDYFLIYHNKLKASIIPKVSFNENQLFDFRELIKSINIKSNLKS